MEQNSTHAESFSSLDITKRHSYPRPQLVRDNWLNLNGTWQFAIDHNGSFRSLKDVSWDKEITVPYAPETLASGVNDQSHYKVVWYRRSVHRQNLRAGDRLVLHFGAVDWCARVYINGGFVGSHEGGYTPFSIDITEQTDGVEEFEIAVRAEDNPHDLEKNRGKQDWEQQEHSIWYPRTTGIWQTVWLETTPACSVADLAWSPRVDDWTVGFTVWLGGSGADCARLSVSLNSEALPLEETIFTITEEERNIGIVERRIDLHSIKSRLELPDDYINVIRERLMWHPDRPNLIDACVKLLRQDFSVIDEVRSYTALRTAQCVGRSLQVNGRAEKLRLVLDQGYWLETGMTPPSDDALREDVELVKAAGFNGVRRHNKLEDPRFLYWADVLGLYVWEELPSAYRFTPKSASRSISTWTEALRRDRNHPCIIAWVPINESWGLPQLPTSLEQRRFQRSMYDMTKSLTGGIVIGNDGWEMVASDILAIHDYDADIERIGRRYQSDPDSVQHLFRNERPGGRVLLLDEMSYDDKPVMLTEFGGIKLSPDAQSWGYSVAMSGEDLANKFVGLMQVVTSSPLLSGFCYTEFTDVYQEANGLFDINRRPKFNLEIMRQAVRR